MSVLCVLGGDLSVRMGTVWHIHVGFVAHRVGRGYVSEMLSGLPRSTLAGWCSC